MDLTTIDLGRSRWSRLGRKLTRAERVSFAFAISGDTGAPASSVAYAEIAPGGGIPMLLDSANECDVILEGELEVELNGETRTAAQSVLRAAHRPPTTWFAVTGTS